jgi:hypothetical protein
MNPALKAYLETDGNNFENGAREGDLRKVIKLLGKRGWKYSQEKRRGKTFCITEGHSFHPNNRTIEEGVSITMVWKK